MCSKINKSITVPILAKHNEIGEKGEKLACDYLLNKGYLLLEKNYRYRKSELDLVMFYNAQVVVVEVKTRSTNYFGEPFDFVDTKKQNMLIEGASGFLEERDNLDAEIRFDVVSILLNLDGTHRIDHLEDAFGAY